MTYYVAEIRFNRASRNLKRDRKTKKPRTLCLITLILVSLLFSASIVIISTVSCKNGGHEDDCSDCDDDGWVRKLRWRVIRSLKRLRWVVSWLPKRAFKNPENAEEQKETLRSMICTVIELIEARKYDQALDLMEEIKSAIREWIRHCWQTYLIKKVDYIIELLEKLRCIDKKPPAITSVLMFPDTPNYDEPVTVIAQVIDGKGGIESVILSYKANSASWTNMTMGLEDGLYVAEIPSQVYNTTVSYRVYAYDQAANLAVSETYSYLVIDSYAPIVSYIEHVPASPSYNEIVTVFANLTEPAEASGVKNVTLWYRTEGDWNPEEMALKDELYVGVIPEFPYGTVVRYRVCAFDYAGNQATSGIYSYIVEAPANIPPIAKFTVSAAIVYTSETISFDASESYDPDGDILSYFWDFGDTTNATDIVVEHSYSDDGSYAVILTVVDDNGTSATAISIMVVLNRAPVASFVADKTAVLTREIIHFDSSDSEDPDGSVIAYIWDFGDGTGATGVIANHAYNDDGVHEVALTVIDNDGTTSSTSDAITVSNRPPIALFTENVTTTRKNEGISFNASESYDTDGSIISYFWEFGDGANATGMTVEHAFAEDGNFTVTLTVTDDDEASSSTSSTKHVETLAEFPLAWLAAIALAIAALTGAGIYALYRRRKKKQAGSPKNPKNRSLVSFYVPSKILRAHK